MRSTSSRPNAARSPTPRSDSLARAEARGRGDTAPLTRRSPVAWAGACQVTIRRARWEQTGIFEETPTAETGKNLTEEIATEYSKVIPAMGDIAHAFVYVTDETMTTGTVIPANCYVIDFSKHVQFFGRVVAVLRAFAVAEETSRAGRVDCEEVGQTLTSTRTPLKAVQSTTGAKRRRNK